MRAGRVFTSAVVLVSAACGGGPPGPVALQYELPDPAVLTYVTGDTTAIDIDAGGQSFQVTQNTGGTYATSFARADDGVRVSLEVLDFSGRMTTPIGAPVSVDAGDIDGPLVFTLDRLGGAGVVRQPTVTAEAGTFFGALATAHTFFPGLPGRPVQVGDAWTDTVRFSGPQGEGEISAVTILTYTVTRDTVLAGRSVLRFDVAGTTEQTATSTIQDMNLTQNVSGDLEGYVLWDLSRGVMVEKYGEADLRGSMNMSAAPFPLTMRVRGQSRSRLQS